MSRGARPVLLVRISLCVVDSVSAMSCPVLLCRISLGVCYALSSTDVAHAGTRISARGAMKTLLRS
eukprot:1491505-Rhodomonas_salina.1